MNSDERTPEKKSLSECKNKEKRKIREGIE